MQLVYKQLSHSKKNEGLRHMYNKQLHRIKYNTTQHNTTKSRRKKDKPLHLKSSSWLSTGELKVSHGLLWPFLKQSSSQIAKWLPPPKAMESLVANWKKEFRFVAGYTWNVGCKVNTNADELP